jgi:hypothetical protein
MTRYYDTRDNKIKNLTIPEELLPKKPFLLPVEINKISIQDTETTDEVGGIKVENGIAIWTVIKKYHVDTLEETKDKKIKMVTDYYKTKMPTDEEKLNSLIGGIYDKTKEDKIKQDVKDGYKTLDDITELINNCLTIEEVEAVEYLTEEDKLKQLENNEMIP